ncbi:hypothetical protein [Helicobacter didelphidarum]|uniref:hypothetical protein n=1 Tax=Helicobacter didelphidarum TaxID=2040648 RepID=UPI0011C04796|nr:hypothetical protein [Helicobacter didelphidarum]
MHNILHKIPIGILWEDSFIQDFQTKTFYLYLNHIFTKLRIHEDFKYPIIIDNIMSQTPLALNQKINMIVSAILKPCIKLK